MVGSHSAGQEDTVESSVGAGDLDTVVAEWELVVGMFGREGHIVAEDSLKHTQVQPEVEEGDMLLAVLVSDDKGLLLMVLVVLDPWHFADFESALDELVGRKSVP